MKPDSYLDPPPVKYCTYVKEIIIIIIMYLLYFLAC
jgi:hypothetical protein